ncbi:MAG: hypothetical protein V4598_08135 [Bdellovibrionota bacterium]
MRFHHIFFCILILIPGLARAYELVVIQGISETKRSFITRNGKRQGVIIGMTGTFTSENISILAKAVNVTGQYAQWEIINKEAIIPFEKGSMVTWYPAQEYLWALSPESERKKYIKSQMVITRSSFIFKGAITRGLSESVSDVQASNPTRGGYMGEVYYERPLTPNISFDLGLRYEQEVINYTGVSLTTKRNLAIGDVIYYFDGLKELLGGGKIYIAAGLGYGLSNTETVGLSQSGPVGLLPAVKIGLSLPFSADWDFLLDSAFESLQTREEQEDGRVQTTTQTNLRMGIGLRRYY